jgi:nucleotide-binding universal stress UspA family protein
MHMPLKDILLYVESYPEPIQAEAIEQAVRFAAAAGGALTALAVQVDLRAPNNWLADRLIGLSRLCAEQEEKSLATCRAALKDFSERLASAGVTGETRLTKVDPHLAGEHVALHARTRDLCLIPATDRPGGHRSVTEAVVFGSGRPILLYRPGVADLMSRPITVVVAWDGSRPAVRAMADALPLLSRARQVRVLTVVNEKAEARANMGRDVVRHLALHGVDAVADDVDAGGRKIGEVFSAYVAQHHADLLVMGAYGRSRMRDFILGGATGAMLRDPKVPLLMSR